MKQQKVLAAAFLMVAAAACKTGGESASLKDDGAPTSNGNANVPTAATGVVGMDILTNEPAVTQIDPAVQPASDWDFGSGREYWLYSSRGKYMTFSADGKYAPYQNNAACDGKEDDTNSACSVQPDNVAKACQHTASLTLKALFEQEPEEYTAIQKTYGGSFSLFGWMNDGHSDASFATNTWQGPFIWRGSAAAIQVGGACPNDFKSISGYVKWVSSVDKNGVCKTPSKGQFLALIQKARECLEQNNPAPTAGN